jgi:flavin-dependent dehydrogenase
LDNFSGAGWLAVGDAALSFDPLSSQGILTALYTGMEVGLTLLAQLSGNADAVARYRYRLANIYEAYLRNLTAYYSSEERWPERASLPNNSNASDAAANQRVITVGLALVIR